MDFDDVQEGEFRDTKPVQIKPKRVSTPHNPKPLDIDLNAGEMPFEKFCQSRIQATITQSTWS
jgi:hypothetical protein